MNYNKLPQDLSTAVRPADVRLYLQSRGWVSQPYDSRGSGLVFHHASFPDIDLLLPLQRTLRDYAERMEDLLVALAAVEQHRSGKSSTNSPPRRATWFASVWAG